MLAGIGPEPAFSCRSQSPKYGAADRRLWHLQHRHWNSNTPSRAKTDPTERSMPPVIITIPMPMLNMARLIGAYGIFSIGIGIVIITGGIDLSVGSVFALLGVLLSMMLTQWSWPAALAVLAVVGISMGLGLMNGLLVTRLGIQPFIVTLCGLLFYRGLARFIANDETKGFGSGVGFEWLQKLATGSVFNIPMPFILLLVIAAIMWVVLHRSVYGRYLFA